MGLTFELKHPFGVYRAQLDSSIVQTAQVLARESPGHVDLLFKVEHFGRPKRTTSADVRQAAQALLNLIERGVDGLGILYSLDDGGGSSTFGGNYRIGGVIHRIRVGRDLCTKQAVVVDEDGVVSKGPIIDIRGERVINTDREEVRIFRKRMPLAMIRFLGSVREFSEQHPHSELVMKIG